MAERRVELIHQIHAAGVLCALCPGQITEPGEGYADLSFIAAGDGLRGRVLEACLKAAREGLDQIAGRGSMRQA